MIKQVLPCLWWHWGNWAHTPSNAINASCIFPAYLLCRTGLLKHFSQEEKWYFQAPTRGLIWAACGGTQQNMLVWPLVIQNSEWLWQTPVLPPSQVFQLKNYNCRFCALNIIQVNVFWYLMMITFNFSQRCGQPRASDYHFLEDSSTRVGAEQQLSLFYAWLVRRLLKPDELIFHEGRLPITEGWGRGKVRERTYFKAQPEWPQESSF